MPEPIRIVVVDDHPLYRSGVVATLREHDGIVVVGEGASGEDALTLVRTHQPDIALLDISMPGNGLEAIAAIKAAAGSTKVIMLSASEDEDEVMQALDAGAAGYAIKGIGGDDLATIIHTVKDGGSYVAPTLAARLLMRSRALRADPTDGGFAALSARELDVARLLPDGLSNKEIANRLGLQEKTVKHHMTQVLQKLRVRNRVEAAMKARSKMDRK